ncbi:MAG: hypothetical protein QOG17_2100 [Gammaproteobacteria bacterium]|nr:hypothetical protein [Gammaproteobacteria bacterium]
MARSLIPCWDIAVRAIVRLALLVLFLGSTNSAVRAAESPSTNSGESIYRDGRLASGALVRAERGGSTLQGAPVACVNCHRRSGLGSYEGSVLIPPIIGPYLFRVRAVNTADLGLPHVPGFTPNRYAYTEKALATAIRSGIAADGRVMNALMPRYSLDDASLGELVDYLRNLSAGPFPGVSDQALSIATIVTPDADPIEREAMLEVIEKYFKVRNAAVASRIQGDGPSTAGAAQYRAVRNWRLQVWELSGPAATWEEQLQRRQTSDPVFAVVSGLGQTTWAPIQSFCEKNKVPCLFPNLDLPPAGGPNYYSMYFSRGVLLEADLILARVSSQDTALSGAGRIVQVFRSGDIGAGSAEALTRAAENLHIAVVNRVLPALLTRLELKTALTDLHPQDTLVLWLRPPDVALLGDAVPSSRIYLSGMMANLEDAPLPAAWRGSVYMTYPYDPPDRRRVRLNFPHAWFHQHGIAITADRVQSNTYLACIFVADTLDSLLDSYVPDFLIERLETMAGNELSTGYFPRLSLASGQRFASKGGYIVKFDARDRGRVLADGDWLAP